MYGKTMTATSVSKIKTKCFSEKLRGRIKIGLEDADNYKFKIADRKDEYESACRLVHDKYVQKGYMTPTESGLRLSLQNALPETTTFIGKKKDTIISTLTIFQDSEMGLPMDAIYKQELDHLRQQGRKIVEVGALAVHPSICKQDQTVLMHGNKIMHSYSREYLGVDDLVVAINPRHQWFYEHILLFEQIGELKAYNYVKKAPAVAYRLDLNKAEIKYKATYQNKPLEKNLYRFFYVDKSPCIQYPEKNRHVCFWNKDRIKYFFEIKTQLLTESTEEMVRCLENNYHPPCKKDYDNLPDSSFVFNSPLFYAEFNRPNYILAAKQGNDRHFNLTFLPG